MVLIDAFGLLLAAVGVVAVAGFALWAGVGLAAFTRWVREHLPSRARLDYERYHAEQSIRTIRREAIRDMLDAERDHRYAYNDPDIIEGTAVEVRR